MKKDLRDMVLFLGLATLAFLVILGFDKLGWIPKDQDVVHPLGALEVRVKPQEADIFLNGIWLEQNVTQLSAGEYQLDVLLPGYTSQTIRFEVEEGKTTVVTPELKKIPNAKNLAFVIAGVLICFFFLPIIVVAQLEHAL